MRSSSSGQANVEYVAVVGVVAVVLALLVAAAAAAPGLRELVEDRIRYALCVAGADVCDRAHARAEGLEPCTTSDTLARAGASATLFSLSLADGSSVQVQERSDGSVLLSTGRDNELGTAAGFGFEYGPGKAGGSAEGAIAFRRGTTFVTDRVGLRQVLERFRALEDPTWGSLMLGLVTDDATGDAVTRYHELGLAAGLSASVSLESDADARGLSYTLGAGGARAAVGRSVTGRTSTLHYRLEGRATGR